MEKFKSEGKETENIEEKIVRRLKTGLFPKKDKTVTVMCDTDRQLSAGEHLERQRFVFFRVEDEGQVFFVRATGRINGKMEDAQFVFLKENEAIEQIEKEVEESRRLHKNCEMA